MDIFDISQNISIVYAKNLIKCVSLLFTLVQCGLSMLTKVFNILHDI